MITCEVCGNDFNRGRYITKRDKDLFIACPYCGHENKKIYLKSNKKKGAKRK